MSHRSGDGSCPIDDVHLTFDGFVLDHGQSALLLTGTISRTASSTATTPLVLANLERRCAAAIVTVGPAPRDRPHSAAGQGQQCSRRLRQDAALRVTPLFAHELLRAS